VSLLALLLLARFTGPRPVALLAAGTAVVTVANTLSTVGVEFILPVVPPEQLRPTYKRGAAALAFSVVAVVLAWAVVAPHIGQPRAIGWFTAGGVLALSIGQLMAAVAIRARQVVLVGHFRFAIAACGAVGQGCFVAIGGAGRPWGLFEGYVAGSVVASIAFLARVIPAAVEELPHDSADDRKPPWRIHLQAATASALNSVALQGPSIVFPAVLGSNLAGKWSVVNRICTAPVILTSGPLTTSVNAEFAYHIREHRTRDLPRLLHKWRRRLFLFSLVAGGASAAAVYIAGIALGPGWGGLLPLTPLALAYAIPQAAVSPTGQALNLVGATGRQLVWDIARLAAIAIVISTIPGGRGLLTGFVLVMFAFYVWLHALTTRTLNRYGFAER
jgi:O-antigen/teichoic acid export membrane protein